MGKNPISNVCLGGCTITSMCFEMFSSLQVSLWGPSTRIFFQKTLILAFEANSALSCQIWTFHVLAHCVYQRSLQFLIGTRLAPILVQFAHFSSKTFFPSQRHRRDVVTQCCLIGFFWWCIFWVL